MPARGPCSVAPGSTACARRAAPSPLGPSTTIAGSAVTLDGPRQEDQREIGRIGRLELAEPHHPLLRGARPLDVDRPLEQAELAEHLADLAEMPAELEDRRGIG